MARSDDVVVKDLNATCSATLESTPHSPRTAANPQTPTTCARSSPLSKGAPASTSCAPLTTRHRHALPPLSCHKKNRGRYVQSSPQRRGGVKDRARQGRKILHPK